MDSIDLIFIYEYDKKMKYFIITNIELAKNNIFITGNNQGKKVYSVYEKLYLKNDNHHIKYTVDISSIKNGFIKFYNINLDNNNFNYNYVIEDSFSYAFKCYCYEELISEGEELVLNESEIKIGNKSLKDIKVSFMQRVFNLIVNYKLKNNNLEEIAIIPDNEIKIRRKRNVKYIIEKIKKKVIAQDDAIDIIVPAVMLNQKLIEINDSILSKTQKSTILIDGSTGVGKTLIVEELAKLIDVPIVISGITNYSAVAYKGSNLSEVINNLIVNANGNIEKAQKGIICFDEIDKLGDTSMEMRKAVAQELLTWINGTNINLQYKGNEISFNTSNITFICLGAFGKMREEKTNTRLIGFNSQKDEKQNIYETDDYIKFGMQRELMGRFNTLITLNDLERKDYKNILLFSDISPLKSFIDLASIYDVEVDFNEGFLDKLVELSVKEGIGARALQRQMNVIRNKYIIPIMDKEISRIYLTSEVFEKDYLPIKDKAKDLTLTC